MFKWLLKAPSAIWALTFCTSKSQNRNCHQMHAKSFMAFTGDITAKLVRKNKKLSLYTVLREQVAKPPGFIRI